MTITVFIRYRLDPFKREAFETYARRGLSLIPNCGGAEEQQFVLSEERTFLRPVAPQGE